MYLVLSIRKLISMAGQTFVYSIRTYNTLKASLIALPVFCFPIAAVIYIGMSIGSPAFAVIGGMVVLGTPFFFQKIYKSLFTRIGN